MWVVDQIDVYHLRRGIFHTIKAERTVEFGHIIMSHCHYSGSDMIYLHFCIVVDHRGSIRAPTSGLQPQVNSERHLVHPTSLISSYIRDRSHDCSFPSDSTPALYFLRMFNPK